ncbi:MAG: CPBP family intramembrane metalloprotease [Clostridia bacterium]|nr:CPBP family intramembrane metalloprotease [Clostridia bacterium]
MQNQYGYQPPYQYACTAPVMTPSPTPADVDSRKLRKHGLFVGACLLGNYGIQTVASFLLSFFGFGKILSKSIAVTYGVNALFFAFLSMGVPFFLYSLRKGNASYFKALPFYTPQPRAKLLLTVLTGWALCMSANLVVTLVSFWFNIQGIEFVSPTPAASENVLDIAMNFVCAGFMAPLIEEFAFRGVIMQPLRRYGDSFAIYVTAFIFAMAHGNPVSIVFAFLAGAVIGYAVVYTRSIWVGIIIHALNNCTSVFFTEIGRFRPDVFNAAYNILLILLVIIGIVCIVVWGKVYGFRLQRNFSGVRGFKRVTAFFISPTMVPVLIYLVFSMARYIRFK